MKVVHKGCFGTKLHISLMKPNSLDITKVEEIFQNRLFEATKTKLISADNQVAVQRMSRNLMRT